MTALCAVKGLFLPGEWAYGSREGVTIFHPVCDKGAVHQMQTSSVRVHVLVSPESWPEARHGLSASESACALHDAHNALQWYFETTFANSKELVKTLYLELLAF